MIIFMQKAKKVMQVFPNHNGRSYFRTTKENPNVWTSRLSYSAAMIMKKKLQQFHTKPIPTWTELEEESSNHEPSGTEEDTEQVPLNHSREIPEKKRRKKRGRSDKETWEQQKQKTKRLKGDEYFGRRKNEPIDPRLPKVVVRGKSTHLIPSAPPKEKEGDGPWIPYMGRGERSTLTMDDEPQPSTSAQLSAIERCPETKEVSLKIYGNDEDVELQCHQRGDGSKYTPLILVHDKEIELPTSSMETSLPMSTPEEEDEVLENVEDNTPTEKIPEPITLTELQFSTIDPTDPAFYANKRLSAELINEALKLESQT
ncbi:hypothetical protein J6590_089304 [Homalodisca vitripennis]|nr:hypothetical protein J6590_089304 [Homalodisca vitripennis]